MNLELQIHTYQRDTYKLLNPSNDLIDKIAFEDHIGIFVVHVNT